MQSDIPGYKPQLAPGPESTPSQEHGSVVNPSHGDLDGAGGGQEAWWRLHKEAGEAAAWSQLTQARLLSEEGRHDEACDLAEQARALAPANPIYDSGLAQALVRAGRLTEVKAVVARGLANGLEQDVAQWWLSQAGPSQAWSRLTQARLLSEQGNHDEACEAAEQACALAPDNPIYDSGLAEVLTRAGRLEAAEAALARGMENGLDQAEAQWWLSQVRAQQ